MKERKMSNDVKKITFTTNKILKHISDGFIRNNITVIMPTYMPQRGEVLRALAVNGVDTMIVGGPKNSRFYKEIPQIGTEIDVLPHIGVFPPHITKEIVQTIPENKLKNKKIAIFSFINSIGWSNYIKERNLNTEIVATVEQSLRNYFEEKGNLIKILQTAGLEAYIIPTEHVSKQMSYHELYAVYHKLKNEDGKVVLQDIRSKVANAAGKGTFFVDSLQDFLKTIQLAEGEFKAVRFIKGFESNLTFFATNTLPDDTQSGAKKLQLTPELDPYNPDTLDILLKRAANVGINDENIVTLVGRGTFKAVGDDNLTSNAANGVGNDLGYVYPPEIRQQIKEIGDKLSHLMALAGKVGVAGADLLIDKDGKVWINEINDRLQGPTSQMSKDAERNGAPSISKINLIASYADFNSDEIQQYFQNLKKYAEEINDFYTTKSGEFYLKVNSIHPSNETAVFQHNILPGFYDIKKQDGKWYFDFSSHRGLNSDTNYQTDITKDYVTIKIDGGDWHDGDTVKGGSQLFRLTGVATKGQEPFTVQQGKTVLSEEWQNIVKATYDYLFGKGYMERNPLRQKRKQTKNIRNIVPSNDILTNMIISDLIKAK